MDKNIKRNDRVWIVRAPAERRAFVRVIADGGAPRIHSKGEAPKRSAISAGAREQRALTRFWRFARLGDKGSSPKR